MTNQEARQFLDCVTYEDAIAVYGGYAYWCCGICWDKEKHTYSLEVHKYKMPLDSTTPLLEVLFDVECRTKEECLKQFVEAKFWDGKSFWEVAKELKWW